MCVCATGCIVLSVKGLCTMAQWSREQFTAPHLPKNDILYCVIRTTETKQDTNKFCTRSLQMEGLDSQGPWDPGDSLLSNDKVIPRGMERDGKSHLEVCVKKSKTRLCGQSHKPINQGWTHMSELISKQGLDGHEINQTNEGHVNHLNTL